MLYTIEVRDHLASRSTYTFRKRIDAARLEYARAVWSQCSALALLDRPIARRVVTAALTAVPGCASSRAVVGSVEVTLS